MNLYRFTHKNHSEYVISTLEPNIVRDYSDRWDHGATGQELFSETFRIGTVEKITSYNQVEVRDLDIIPFCTDEWIESEQDYLDVEVYIKDFLDEYHAESK